MTATVSESPETGPGARLLSCAQAARVLGLTTSRTSQLRREGRLAAIRTPLGYLFDPDELARFQTTRKKGTR